MTMAEKKHIADISHLEGYIQRAILQLQWRGHDFRSENTVSLLSGMVMRFLYDNEKIIVQEEDRQKIEAFRNQIELLQKVWIPWDDCFVLCKVTKKVLRVVDIDENGNAEETVDFEVTFPYCHPCAGLSTSFNCHAIGKSVFLTMEDAKNSDYHLNKWSS